MNKTYDVICVGSALLDIYLKSSQFKSIPTGEYAEGVALCEAFGGKTEVEEVEVTTGGGASNNAVSYARKGFSTAILAELGKDLIATTVIEDMKHEGVDCSLLVQEADEDTGISSIMVASSGARSVAVHHDASGMLTAKDIPWEAIHNTRWLHVSSVGGELPLLEQLFLYASQHDIKIAFNPGAKELQLVNQWKNKLLHHVHVLQVNREEAAVLLGKQELSDEDWLQVHIPGPHICLITNGKHGGQVITDQERLVYQGAEVTVVEETGAGDAFGSGFVASLMTRKSIPEAIAFATKQAASVVSFMGAKKGLLREVS